MPDKPVSRQREWQLRKAAEGKCQNCGRRTKLAWVCRKCRPKKYAAKNKSKETNK